MALPFGSTSKLGMDTVFIVKNGGTPLRRVSVNPLLTCLHVRLPPLGSKVLTTQIKLISCTSPDNVL